MSVQFNNPLRFISASTSASDTVTCITQVPLEESVIATIKNAVGEDIIDETQLNAVVAIVNQLNAQALKIIDSTNMNSSDRFPDRLVSIVIAVPDFNEEIFRVVDSHLNRARYLGSDDSQMTFQMHTFNVIFADATQIPHREGLTLVDVKIEAASDRVLQAAPYYDLFTNSFHSDEGASPAFNLWNSPLLSQSLFPIISDTHEFASDDTDLPNLTLPYSFDLDFPTRDQLTLGDPMPLPASPVTKNHPRVDRDLAPALESKEATPVAEIPLPSVTSREWIMQLNDTLTVQEQLTFILKAFQIHKNELELNEVESLNALEQTVLADYMSTLFFKLYSSKLEALIPKLIQDTILLSGNQFTTEIHHLLQKHKYTNAYKKCSDRPDLQAKIVQIFTQKIRGELKTETQRLLISEYERFLVMKEAPKLESVVHRNMACIYAQSEYSFRGFVSALNYMKLELQADVEQTTKVLAIKWIVQFLKISRLNNNNYKNENISPKQAKKIISFMDEIKGPAANSMLAFFTTDTFNNKLTQFQQDLFRETSINDIPKEETKHERVTVLPALNELLNDFKIQKNITLLLLQNKFIEAYQKCSQISDVQKRIQLQSAVIENFDLSLFHKKNPEDIHEQLKTYQSFILMKNPPKMPRPTHTFFASQYLHAQASVQECHSFASILIILHQYPEHYNEDLETYNKIKNLCDLLKIIRPDFKTALYSNPIMDEFQSLQSMVKTHHDSSSLPELLNNPAFKARTQKFIRDVFSS